MSAKTGLRVTRVLDVILEVAAERTKRITTSEVNNRLEQLVARRQLLEGLLGQLIGLGEEVKGLRGDLQAIAPDGPPAAVGPGDGAAGPGVVDVPGVVNRISALGERARSFADQAREQDFPELAAKGHALGQQLDSVAGRARQLQRAPREVS